MNERASKMSQEFTILQLGCLDDSGDSQHRVRWPGRQLAGQAPHWRVITLSSEAQERYAWAERADLLILYQSHDLDLLPVIERRRTKGLKTLAEYNDNFYDPPPTSNAADVWRSPLIQQNYELIMKACDALIVTGAGLRALFSGRISQPIFILENHCPGEPPAFDEVWRKPDDTFHIGWAGSAGHMADILSIVPTLRALMKEYPQIRLHLMGNPFFKTCPGLDSKRLAYRDRGTMADYLDFLKPLHLGLIPMIDTAYNRCRSDIKAIEMGSQGVLPLLPDRLPYHKILSETALTPCTSPRELRARIVHYMHHLDALQDDAQRLHAYICRHRVGPRRRERLTLYRRMLPKRPTSGDWALPPGYHEIHGARAEYQPTLTLTQQVATLHGEQRWEEALSLTRQARRDNPGHPDLALLELRILASAKGKEKDWRKQLQAAQSRFPADLRFDLFELRHASTPQKRVKLWTRFLTRLEKETPHVLAFYEKEIATLMEDALHQDSTLLNLAEKLLTIYPHALALMQRVALACESGGDFSKAKRYFQEIADAKTALSQDDEFLEKINTSWLETWHRALTARVRESKKQVS